ncbi:SusC/RagA family TonB-linked outer membrane protein [Sphingobacterium sp. DK4209]|uniref:SusC/RagA family TonB-linked outer membrane protein n=1 Tax=Sphingobacterium zhuxiongii TaxID=2662364 RepID=A0A5Q0QBU4_9SPHI|nr:MULTISPECIES: TonB-dependent receptor [unclassified Sphingobacterium]MVZ65246.1 SusC/RagA family TonB-linked outer membrane protein [Sphingobacterium sp. DK4209]QGA26341.1 SusC/RagA family TonB-linked outer membrane protein [Sphingobacterium sp. dk4302]
MRKISLVLIVPILAFSSQSIANSHFLFGSGISSSVLWTQQSVQGRVVASDTDEPLVGVTVSLKGKQGSTITNSEGHFTIAANRGDVLVFSMLNFAKFELPVGAESVDLRIALERSSEGLDEVVVVGYGVQKKATLTGSVASVQGDVLKRSPAVSVTNSLSGLMPGLIALNRSGEPGADVSSLLIRGVNTTGTTSPLVVVDGIQNPSGWQRINQNDIESINILKDASAAIYGAQAANGVILITTKRGKSGKPVINYSMNIGMGQPTRTPKLASSAVFADYVNDLLIQSGQDPRYTDAEIEKFRLGNDPNYPNINWYDEVLKNISTQQIHNLNLRGGSEKVRYSISGSYSNQNSIFKKGIHDYDGFTVRSNIDADVTKDFTVSVDLNSVYNNRVRPGTVDPWYWLNGLPMVPVYYENGLPSAGIENGYNPSVMASDAAGKNSIVDKNYNIKGGFNWKIPKVEGLELNGYLVYTDGYGFNKNWRTPWKVYNYDSTNDTYIPMTGGAIVSPDLNIRTDKSDGMFYNLKLSYHRTFKDHFISAFVAGEQSSSKSNYQRSFRRNFLSTAIDELFAGDPATQESDGMSYDFGRQSVFGRLSYNYKEKYLVDMNARFDGSYAFAPKKRFGFFPGISVAWVASKDLFPESTVVNDLKIRGSVGQLGNDQINPYQYLASYNLGLQYGYHFGQTPKSSLGSIPNVTPNPDITWEVATISNIGLDASFLNRTFELTFDVFKQNRSNILALRDLEIPAYTSLSLPTENIGEVENRGIETGLKYNRLAAGDFKFSLGGNFGYSKNKVISLSEASNVPDYQKAEGKLVGAELYYQAIGVIRTEEQLNGSPIFPGSKVGDLQYQDINGNGVIDAGDRMRMDRSNIPQITFGLNAHFQYRNFSLFMNFAGQAKAWQYYHQNARIGVNGLEDLIVNRWRPGSMDSKYPRVPTLTSPGEPSALVSTFWLQNASFLRLKTLELGYDLDPNLISQLKLSSARVFVNGNNLFTLSEIKWYDPEGTSDRGTFYPQSKVFNIGLSVAF